jgi:8-oxo-dGTP pyrophosphatase MutT (NUDIX family)
VFVDTVRVLETWRLDDAPQELLRLDYLNFLREHDDGVFRECRIGHITASAIVIDPTRSDVLLTLHPKVGRWLQLGGHIEPGDHSLHEAAMREVREESGLLGSRISRHPLRLDRHTVPCGSGQMSVHLDVQFGIEVPETFAPVASEESLDLRWFSVDDLPDDVDASVRALLGAARDWRH